VEQLQPVHANRTRPSTTVGPAFPSTPLVTSVGFVVSKAAQALREAFDAKLRPLGVISRHYGILSAVEDLGPSSPEALGQVLQLDNVTTSLLLNHLEYIGLAYRRRDPADMLRVLVEITPAGQSVVKQGRKLAQQVEDQFAAPLTAAERAKLYEWMLRLLQESTR
jgi:DNA-binding MarR family transcriptional regulator